MEFAIPITIIFITWLWFRGERAERKLELVEAELNGERRTREDLEEALRDRGRRFEEDLRDRERRFEQVLREKDRAIDDLNAAVAGRARRVQEDMTSLSDRLQQQMAFHRALGGDDAEDDVAIPEFDIHVGETVHLNKKDPPEEEEKPKPDRGNRWEMIQ